MVLRDFAALAAGVGRRDEESDGPVDDTGTVTLEPVAISPTAVDAATDSDLDGRHREELADALSALPDDGPGLDRAERVSSLATELAADGVAPSTFVAAYTPLVEALVDDVLADVSGTDEVAAELKRNLRATLEDVTYGVDAFAGVEGAATDATPDEAVESDLSLADAIEAIPHSTFLIDADHTVVAYNGALANQLDFGETEALGEDCRESIAAATYSDGRRHKTLADKVIEAPRTADEEFDVDRIDDSYEFGSRTVYEDVSLMNTADGREQHISFQAIPLFGPDGECSGVLELVEDQSAEIRRQETMTALVEEVCSTLEAFGDGDVTARAEFEDEAGVVDAELLRIVTEVNEMVAEFGGLVRQVSERTDDLSDSIDGTVEAAEAIDEQVVEQNEALTQVATEMEDFSATMEEVAASADQVASAANEALDEAADGKRAGIEARDSTAEVLETSQQLVETVAELDEYMDEIEAVTDVIADIADQTNILALNANIEAARAGEDGEGFAVVANEVKQLADETQAHTEDIARQVGTVQEQTAATVREVEESYDQIMAADERIGAAVESLREIADAVEEATNGIDEVAAANDQQAATVEEVLSTVEQTRETAETVETTVETIVAETERQQDSVAGLAQHVDSLTDGS
jgi:methyl-accepting chemotaxis protein